MAQIIDIKAREIFDSRGLPALEVDVLAEGGFLGRASVPSGASTGSFEALELRDGDPNRFHGKGLLRACEVVSTNIREALKGMPVTGQRVLDQKLIELDGTPNKSKLGANSTLGVSLASCKAASLVRGKPLRQYLLELFQPGGEPLLPIPMINIINGGRHADNAIDIQEFMIVPLGCKSFKEAMQIGVEIFQSLKNLLKSQGLATSVGDEGGFAPALRSTEAVLDLIAKAAEQGGRKLRKDVGLALDIAASNLLGHGPFSQGKYQLRTDHGPSKKDSRRSSGKTSQEMIDWYEKLCEAYPILSIEDGLAEEDWEGWRIMTQRLGKRVQLVGDDLFVTHVARLKKGIELSAANAILIKPNQIGTLTETMECIQEAKEAGLRTILSHRSGETEESFLADLAVATRIGQVKMGAPCRSERLAKYNQLLRIEEQLGTGAKMATPFTLG